MYVITRSLGESVVAEGPCVITLLGTDGKRARFGIEADEGTLLYRKEKTPERQGEPRHGSKPTAPLEQQMRSRGTHPKVA